MKIHFNNKEIDILVDTSSYRYTALQNVGTLYLYFASEEFINIPVGAYCIYKNIPYYLMDPDDFKKKSSRNFEYTLVMYDIGAILGKYKCRDIVSKRLKFDYTAKPHEHLQLIVDNLNMRDSGWKVGECIEAEEKTINYNHIFCSEALPTIADTFKTEYEIDPAIKTIHLRKVEYNKGEPLPLEYGKDKGFVPGLGRSNKDGNRPVTILYVQGGEQNIDFSKYGSKELLLPKNQRLEYEGRAYVSDAEGLYIKRADTTLTDVQEDSLDCSHISPKRVGSVSNVVVSDKEKNFYDFIDSSIPDDLNFEDYVIEGNNMTVIFQSGMLAGSNKEFEVKYVHKERKFLITPQEIDGQIMPNDIYKPNLGDKYAVFGIQLPDAYICNNSTKEGASWDMFREAAKYLYENEDPKFTFKGELDSIYSKKHWLSIGGKIKLGGYILFKDPQFIPEGVKIRITSIKEYIHRPYSPIIELSNTTTGVTVSSELNKIESNEVKTDNQYKNSIQFTKRRFRDAKETISMLEEALLDNFTTSINPIAVQTMSMLVGDESLQFRFVNSKTSPVPVTHRIVYDNETKQLTAEAGIIQHMTLGINTVSASHKVSEYKFWDMTAYTSAVLDDGKKKYYLYAKVSKTAQTGVFILSENAIKLEGVSGFYHLLVGVLNSEYDGERSFVTLYGFTEVLPGRITTDEIVSTDGNTYFDLSQGEIGGNIKIKSGSSGLHNFNEWEVLDTQIAEIEESVSKTNSAVGSLNNYVDGAFADGIITKAEAKAIEKYINTVNATKSAVEATYEKLYANAYLTGTAKTGLSNAKNAFSTAISSLITSINTAIKDGKTTAEEKADVDAKYDAFNKAYAAFNTAVEVANKAIQDELKKYSDECNAQLKVLGTQIEAQVERIDKINGTISSAGWITKADGNTLWASKTLENGSTIVSKINQSADTVAIEAQHIKLEGHVTANGNVEFTEDGKIIGKGSRFRNAVINAKIVTVGAVPESSRKENPKINDCYYSGTTIFTYQEDGWEELKGASYDPLTGQWKLTIDPEYSTYYNVTGGTSKYPTIIWLPDPGPENYGTVIRLIAPSSPAVRTVVDDFVIVCRRNMTTSDERTLILKEGRHGGYAELTSTPDRWMVKANHLGCNDQKAMRLFITGNNTRYFLSVSSMSQSCSLFANIGKVSVTRKGKGIADVVFQSYNQYFFENMICRAYGYKGVDNDLECPIKATVYSVTQNSPTSYTVQVRMSDDDTLNDPFQDISGFFLDITLAYTVYI